MTISSQIRRYTRLTARFTQRIHNNTNYTLVKKYSTHGTGNGVFNGRRILPTTAAIRKVHSGNSKSWGSGDGTGSGFADDAQLLLDVVDDVPLPVQRWYSAPGSTDWWRSGPSSTGDSSLLAPPDRTGPDRWYSALSSTRPPNKWAHNNNSFYRYT